MKNNSVAKYVTLAAFGLGMLIAGLVLAKSLPDVPGVMLNKYHKEM